MGLPHAPACKCVAKIAKSPHLFPTVSPLPALRVVSGQEQAPKVGTFGPRPQRSGAEGLGTARAGARPLGERITGGQERT